MTPVRCTHNSGNTTPTQSITEETKHVKHARSPGPRAEQSNTPDWVFTQEHAESVVKKLGKLEIPKTQDKQEMDINEAIDLLMKAEKVEDIKRINIKTLSELKELTYNTAVKFFRAMHDVYVWVLDHPSKSEILVSWCNQQSEYAEKHKIELKKILAGELSHQMVFDAKKKLKEIESFVYDVGLDLFKVYPEKNNFEHFSKFIELVRGMQLWHVEPMRQTLVNHQGNLCNDVLQIASTRITMVNEEVMREAQNMTTQDKIVVVPEYFWAFQKTINSMLDELNNCKVDIDSGEFTLEKSFKFQKAAVELRDWIMNWKAK